ncbi:hypothetical protein L6164_016474 [Bauhinia variegata]|uniref:Uncharacterized protein n=1 Tax=Bauhinia variegata TaxID=167791 RepID=A0ACB9NNQ9_BAUVA|nr:hypothetical protein L6164_016474 [Bauhinia variegata]
MEYFISKLHEWEPRIRKCYAEDIQLDGKMILIDAGFIIELFIRYYDLSNCVETDISFLKPSVSEDVSHDLILLENQLPFFVLEDLYNLGMADNMDKNSPTFLELAFKYFAALNMQNLQPNCVKSVLHFTDLLRIFYIPGRVRSMRRFQVGNILDRRNTTSELVKAGLKLKVDETKKYLLDLRYQRGSLTMSHLDLSDKIEFD